MTVELVASLVTLVGAIAAAAVAVIRELNKGQAAKQDPKVPGSGAAICAELKAGREEQARFNVALARHLGMLLPAAPEAEAKHEANGR